MSPTQDYLSFSDIALPEIFLEKHPELFSRPQLQWLLRNREHNGLKEKGAVLKLGRKLYIVDSKFLQWAYAQEA